MSHFPGCDPTPSGLPTARLSAIQSTPNDPNTRWSSPMTVSLAQALSEPSWAITRDVIRILFSATTTRLYLHFHPHWAPAPVTVTSTSLIVAVMYWLGPPAPVPAPATAFLGGVWSGGGPPPRFQVSPSVQKHPQKQLAVNPWLYPPSCICVGAPLRLFARSLSASLRREAA